MAAPHCDVPLALALSGVAPDVAEGSTLDASSAAGIASEASRHPRALHVGRAVAAGAAGACRACSCGSACAVASLLRWTRGLSGGMFVFGENQKHNHNHNLNIAQNNFVLHMQPARIRIHANLINIENPKFNNV